MMLIQFVLVTASRSTKIIGEKHVRRNCHQTKQNFVAPVFLHNLDIRWPSGKCDTPYPAEIEITIKFTHELNAYV